MGLDRIFEFLTGVEGNHAARRNRNHLACFGIAPWSRRLVPQLKITKARNLNLSTDFERLPDAVKEGVDHVLGFPLIQTHLIK
jgi:hypothetical protein